VHLPHVIPTDIAALGEDLILVGDAVESEVDLGTGPVAFDRIVARISADGHVAWVQPGGVLAAVDALGRVHVTAGHDLLTYDEAGSLVREHSFSDTAIIDDLAALSDGGLLLGLEVFESSLELPNGGTVELANTPPLGVLMRLDADAELVWWREVLTPGTSSGGGAAPSPGFVGVGEDGAGQVMAVTGSGSTAIWESVTIESMTSNGKVAAGFTADGEFLWGTLVAGIEDAGRATASRDAGVLVSGGAVGPLVVGSDPVDYGDPGGSESSPDPQGVVVRLDESGALDDATTMGTGAHMVASGAGRMFVASRLHAAPVGLLWCSNGEAPCDEYRLPETETGFNAVAVTDAGAAYVAGEYRAIPNGAQTEKMQLYIMRLEH
jgi:hypothetical protein